MANFTNKFSEDIDTLSADRASLDLYQIEKSPPKKFITVNVSSIITYLVIATIGLVLLNLLVVLSYQMDFKFPARDKFYFDREDSLPTYFSAILLLISAAVLSFIAVIKRKDKDKFKNHWIGLALIFLALSIDESVSFHEFLIEPLRAKFELTGFLRFPWVIAGGIFVLIFGISYLRFFLALSNKMKVWFFSSGAIYVLGAIGFEMIGGSIYQGASGVQDTSLPYMIVMTIEETLEMTGICLFIFTLLLYIKTYSSKINLSIQ